MWTSIIFSAVIMFVFDDREAIQIPTVVFFPPASWWIGEWQKCSASCGSSGQTGRTVLCVQAVSVDEQKALPSRECEHVPKPPSLSSCNTHLACPADWTAGDWSKVSLEQFYLQNPSFILNPKPKFSQV